MKVVGQLQVLSEGETVLVIDPQIAAAAKLQAQSTLDAAVLLPARLEKLQGASNETMSDSTPEAASQNRATKEWSGYGPRSRVTLIASPLAEPSWGRLVRMSVTLDPIPGAFRSMLEVLNKLHLSCRYVETINDIDLQGRSFFGLDLAEHFIGRDTGGARLLSNLIIPSTMVVIELPEDYRSLDLHDDEIKLHKLLHAFSREENVSNANLIALFQRLLAVEDHENIAVEWISPMSTLNRLRHRLRVLPSLKMHRFSTRLLVECHEGDAFKVDLTPIRQILWDTNIHRTVSLAQARPPIFVKAFFDTDDKVLCWDFYQLANDLVVQFDLKTPTAGREHIWWHWIYQCVEEADGNILASASSARVDGGWSVLQTTVVFPFREDAEPDSKGDIGAIVGCFRKLQGIDGHTTHFETLINKLKEKHLENLGPLRWESGTVCLLENVRVWDSSAGPNSGIRSYWERFAANPFNFTSPLDLERYQLLYSEGEGAAIEGGEGYLRTRRRLAMRIIQKIAGDPGENIAIVGAHRDGKTTVLNLVYDTLKSGSYDFGHQTEFPQTNLIPVRINAALDPPHMFLTAIVRELSNLEKEDEKEAKSEEWRQIRTGAAALLKRVRPILSFFEIASGPIAFSSEGAYNYSIAKLENQGMESQQEALKRHYDDFDMVSHGTLTITALLRRSLDVLRTLMEDEIDIEALREMLSRKGDIPEIGDNRKGTSPGRLLIIVDEFSESSRWGHPQALPLWRYVMESREFSKIKWLLSTSRPIKETIDYSPITNVLHEFNVGSLPYDESERLLDVFSVAAWRKQPLQKASSTGEHLDLPLEDGITRELQQEKIYPVIMHAARMLLLEITSRLAYFMQVVCYHIYDRATRTYIPLITRSLSIEIICDYVLPELSDYFEHQWNHIPEVWRNRVVESLYHQFPNQKDFLRNLNKWKDDVQDLPQGVRKALERSGLRGDDSHSVAPLVACWLLAPEPRVVADPQIFAGAGRSNKPWPSS